MNVLFLTMTRLSRIEDSGIYSDLMRKFRDEGHQVYIVNPVERREGLPTSYTEMDGAHILSVMTLNVQKTNVIEKGVGQVLIEPLFKKAIKKYFADVRFDLILYSTPPITLVGAIKWVRNHNPSAMSYLMLKDIFPQNAVDIGMLSTTGLKGALYHSFRRKERKLYDISDWIGCMSPANVKYVIDHNPEIDPAKVEICPNSFDVKDYASPEKDLGILTKYGLPTDRPIFIYGGNLGKPQGVPFLIECLKANANRKDCHFVVVGDGVEYPIIEDWISEDHPRSVTLIRRLPKEDYDALASSCDVGLIFLDYRFTIPNYPSRLLAYLMQHKPIIACTDPNCDTGVIAEENGYGYYSPSNSVAEFTVALEKVLASDRIAMGEKGFEFLCKNYLVENTYNAIMAHV